MGTHGTSRKLSPGACSTAYRSNRPDYLDGLMLDRSAAGQLSSLSSRKMAAIAGRRCTTVIDKKHDDDDTTMTNMIMVMMLT